MAVVLRKARLSDRKEVLRVCKTTWGGWDYVPQYFTQWIKDKGFYVAVDGRRVIGLAKYTELSPGELWLEGLRVDPERRRKGLGWQISQFMLKEVMKEKPISLRLATGRRNTHSRRIIRRMGFRLKVALWGRDGKIPRKPGPGGTRARAVGRKPDVFIPDPQAAFEYIRKTEEYRASKHLLQHTWQFRTITPALLAGLAKMKRVFACGSNDNIRGLLVVQPGRYESGRLDIGFIEGDRKALGEFHKQVRVFARQQKAKSIAGMARGKLMLRHLGGMKMKLWRRPGKRPWVMVYEYPLNGKKSVRKRKESAQ